MIPICRRLRAALSLAFFALASPGCGTGEPPGAALAPATSTTTVVAVEDGFWSVNGALVASVYPSYVTLGILVGDSIGNEWLTGYVRFDVGAVLAAIPPGATITNATLTVTKLASIGLPFTTLGTDHRIHVDHASFASPAAVAPADWLSLAPGGLDAALLVGGTDAPGLQEFSGDVTAAFKADVAAGRARSDFKLRFETATNGNGAADAASFNDSEGSGGPLNRPVLTVTFTL